MATGTLVSLGEYLNTSYEPDREFVDGVLVERSVGTQLHGLLQTIVAVFLQQFRRTHGIRVFTETRLLVDAATGRHRIPDVMAVEKMPYQKGRVVVDVPAIVVEIKSPDDTFDDILGRCFDYERLSIPNILVMDPDNRRIWISKHGSLIGALEGRGLFLSPSVAKLELKSGQYIEFPFDQLFAELDD